MSKRLKFALAVGAVFGAGFVLCANLSRLFPTNPAYQASFWKVAMCVLILVVMPVWAWLEMEVSP